MEGASEPEGSGSPEEWEPGDAAAPHEPDAAFAILDEPDLLDLPVPGAPEPGAEGVALEGPDLVAASAASPPPPPPLEDSVDVPTDPAIEGTAAWDDLLPEGDRLPDAEADAGTDEGSLPPLPPPVPDEPAVITVTSAESEDAATMAATVAGEALGGEAVAGAAWQTPIPLGSFVPAVPVPEEPRRFRWLHPSRLSSSVLVTLAGVLVLAMAGVSFAGYHYSTKYDGRILPGSRIAGVDVGGMTRSQALTAVQEAVEPQLEREVSVTWKKRSWSVTPEELGARNNAGAVVDEALAASESTPFITKLGIGVLNQRAGFNEDVAFTYPAQGIRGFVQGIASSLDRDPQDASIDPSSPELSILPAVAGRKVLVRKSRAALGKALLAGSATVPLEVRTLLPEKTEDDFDQVLVLHIGDNKLYLYEDGKITRTYTVATGEAAYPTPQGVFEIINKRYMPTWVNPAPTGWGANMPASIPPGPGNPLGTRALDWSAAGIRFHGTSTTSSLGHNASHGCVRMAMADVEELYELVDIGTEILSIQTGGYR